MPGKDERRAVGQEELAFDADAGRDDRVDLREQGVRIDDHAGPDHRRRPAHDPGRKEVEGEMAVGELDRVAGVVPAVVSGDDSETVGEKVDDFSLSFVTPLAAQDGCDFHGRKTISC